MRNGRENMAACFYLFIYIYIPDIYFKLSLCIRRRSGDVLLIYIYQRNKRILLMYILDLLHHLQLNLLEQHRLDHFENWHFLLEAYHYINTYVKIMFGVVHKTKSYSSIVESPDWQKSAGRPMILSRKYLIMDSSGNRFM